MIDIYIQWIPRSFIFVWVICKQVIIVFEWTTYKSKENAYTPDIL